MKISATRSPTDPNRVDVSASFRVIESAPPSHERLRSARLTAKRSAFPVPRADLPLHIRRRRRRIMRTAVLRMLSRPIHYFAMTAT